MTINTKQKYFLETRLYPNKSSSRFTVVCLFLFFTFVVFSFSFYFFSLGAWPVSAFLGFDILLFYWALKINYNTAKNYEDIVLGEKLIIKKCFSNGKELKFYLEPTWLKIIIISNYNKSYLILRSHGESVSIGNFLNKNELVEFARELKLALIIREKNLLNL